MRTNNFFQHLVLGAFLLTTSNVMGQTSTPSNVATGVTDFLGWDNTFPANNFPLMVRHDLNQPIQWFTDALQRMQLSGTLTGQTVGTYTGLDLSGHLGFGIPAGLSRIHIHDDGGFLPAGYRPWMRQGLLVSASSDQVWLGLKFDPLIYDQADAVLNWSDNIEDAPLGPDRLRFIFTSSPVGSVATAATLDGLEAARFTPQPDGESVNFGLGDFFSASDDPSERLDVLDGKVRVRDLPTDPASASTEFVTVNMTNGVLEHRPLGALPDNCEWSMSTSAPNNVYTAVGAPNGACPDASERVGIGTFGPTYKLDVRHNEANGSLPSNVRTHGFVAQVSHIQFKEGTIWDPTSPWC